MEPHEDPGALLSTRPCLRRGVSHLPQRCLEPRLIQVSASMWLIE